VGPQRARRSELKRYRVTLAAALLLALTGGAASGQTRHARTAATPIGSAAIKPLPIITAGDRNNGTTVTLTVGQRLRIVLNSTYWTIKQSTNTTVIRLKGEPTLTPDPSCIPGGGCGTAAAAFLALTPGRAEINATRTTCGEAMSCGPTPDTYTLQVVVRRRR
jgi:hypothetical protein